MGDWAHVRNLQFRRGSFDPALPVAAFDLDSTLLPHRGRGPPAELSRRLLVSLADSFNLVIVTNRRVCAADKLAEVMAPVHEYVSALDADIGAAFAALGARATVYASTACDRDRKPHTGAWEHYRSVVAVGLPIRWAFFCGDAAGRPGDHSSDDYAFALNCGLAFVTPEMLFGSEPPWTDPASVGCRAPIPAMPPGDDALPAALVETLVETLGLRTSTEEFLDRALLAKEPKRICVIMVGSPASGKSRIAEALRRQHGFAVASRDRHGPKFEAAFHELLRGESPRVVVDNTNPSAEERARLVAAARRTGHETVIVHVTTPRDVCFHLNGARRQLGAASVPPIAIHTYWKRLAAPAENEADALVRVPFALAPDAPVEVTQFRYATR
jgi:bifunctional polynucleotide phosphatase/kinase